MDLFDKLKSKYPIDFTSDGKKGILLRVALGIILIILSNGISISAGTLQWIFFITLVCITPILIFLDYRDLWRQNIDNTGLLGILGQGDHQSLLAAIFTTQAIIYVLTGPLEGLDLFLSWAVGFSVGMGLYPITLSFILTATSHLVVKTTPIQIEFQEDISDILETYTNRDWILFNIPFVSPFQDTDYSKYNLVRIPTGDSSDISFITKIPPNLEAEQNNFDMDIYQRTHESPLEISHGCDLCRESDKDTYIRVVRREKIFFVLYRVEYRYICESCMKRSVIDVAESDRIEDLTKADMIAKEI
jgi:hypothetical protein